MALILDGNGLIQGLSAGGLPDGSVNASSLASTLDLSSKTMTFGNVTASGITFPASVSASGNPNTLDDYEEGTWTPTWGGVPLSGSFVYTKIGRVVYIGGQMEVGGTTAGDLGGLPFSSAFDGRETGSVGYQTTNSSTWNVLKNAGTSFRFYAGGTQQQAVSGNSIRFSFFYTVA